MTDRIDYTLRPEVLAALDWQWMKSENPEGFGYYQDLEGEERIGCFKDIPPTMQELLEGLCRVCRETGWFQPVLYGDAETLISGPDPMGERVFKVNEYGSLTNAIAAALVWVLKHGGNNA